MMLSLPLLILMQLLPTSIAHSGRTSPFTLAPTRKRGALAAPRQLHDYAFTAAVVRSAAASALLQRSAICYDNNTTTEENRRGTITINVISPSPRVV